MKLWYIIIFIFILIFAIIIFQDILLFPPILISNKSGENYENFLSKDDILLFFPGNAMNIENALEKSKNSIIINYRPKGKSFGNAIHALKNAHKAYETAQKYKTIIILTWSIGNGIFSEILSSIHLHKWKYPKSIVCVAGIPNLSDLVFDKFGFLSFFLQKKLESKSNYAQFLPKDIPFTMIHGKKYNIVPFYLVKDMYYELKKKDKNVILQVYETKSHNDFTMKDIFAIINNTQYQ
jgi:hypothetical protein